jgi:hypothetical protein
MKQFASTTENFKITGVTQRVEYSNTIGIQYHVDSKKLDVTISDNVVSNFKEHGCIITTISLLFNDKTRNYGHQVLLKRNIVENLENTQTEIISLIDPDADNEQIMNPSIFATIVLTAAKTGAFNTLASQNRTMVTIVPRYSVIQRRATNELEGLDEKLKAYIADGNRELFCVTYSKSRILDTIIESKIIDSIKQAKKDTELKTNLYSALKNVQLFDKNTEAAVNLLDANETKFDPFIAICARLFALILVDLSLSVVVATTDSKQNTLLNYEQTYPENNERKQAIINLIANTTSKPLLDVAPKENVILDGLKTIENKESLYAFLNAYLTKSPVMLNSILNKEGSINYIREPIYNNIPFGFDPTAIVHASHTTIYFNEITSVVTDMTHETPQTTTTRRFAVEKKLSEIPKDKRHEFANVIDLNYNPVEKKLIVTIPEKVKSTFKAYGCTIVNFTATTKNYGHQLMFARNNDTDVFSQTDQNKIISVIDSQADDTKDPKNIAAVILAAAKTGVFDALQEQNQSVTMVPRYSVIQKRASNELDDLDKELKDGLSESIKDFDIFCATYAKIKLLDTIFETDVTGVIKATKKNTQVKNDFYKTLKEESQLVPQNLNAQNKKFDPFLAICARAFSYFLLNLSLRVVETPGETPKTLLKDFTNLNKIEEVEIQKFILDNTSKQLQQEDVEPFTAIKDEQSLIAFLKEQLSGENVIILNSVFSNTSSLNLSDDIHNNIPFGFDPNAIVHATQTTIDFNKTTPVVVTDMTHEPPQTAATKRFAVHTIKTSIPENTRSSYATKINIHYKEASNEVVVTISDNAKSIFQTYGCALASIWVSSKDGTANDYSHRVLFVRGDETAKVVYQTPFSQSTQNEIISVIDSEAQADTKFSQIYEEIILSAAKTGAFDILSKTNQSVTIVPHYSVIQRRATIELKNLSNEVLNTIGDRYKDVDTFCVTYAYIKLLDILAKTDVIGAIKDAKKDTDLKQTFYTDLKNLKPDIVPKSLDATNSEHDPFLAICARVFAHFLIVLSAAVVHSDKPMPKLDEGFQEYVATGKSRALIIPNDLQEFTKIKNKNDVTAFLLNRLKSVDNLTHHIFSKEGIVNHISNEAYNNIPFGFDPDAIVNATQTTIDFNKTTPVVVTDMSYTTLSKLLNNKSIYDYVYETGAAAAAAAPPPPQPQPQP